jgi:hypothetical protein
VRPFAKLEDRFVACSLFRKGILESVVPRPKVCIQSAIKITFCQLLNYRTFSTVRHKKTNPISHIPARWSTNRNSANFYKYCTTLSQNSPKSRLFTRFFIIYKFNESEPCMRYLEVEKVCNCGPAKLSSPQITKGLGMHIANPQSVTFAEGQQM